MKKTHSKFQEQKITELLENKRRILKDVDAIKEKYWNVAKCEEQRYRYFGAVVGWLCTIAWADHEITLLKGNTKEAKRYYKDMEAWSKEVERLEAEYQSTYKPCVCCARKTDHDSGLVEKAAARFFDLRPDRPLCLACERVINSRIRKIKQATTEQVAEVCLTLQVRRLQRALTKQDTKAKLSRVGGPKLPRKPQLVYQEPSHQKYAGMRKWAKRILREAFKMPKPKVEKWFNPSG
jgi:hypothetical protein